MIKKLAITAFALSMSAAFAADHASTTANSAGANEVKQVQQALEDKGQDVGAIDGKMGPKTQAALQSFQQAQGLSGSGSLDSQTLSALGVSGSASASTSAEPSSSAMQPSSPTNPPSMSNSSKQ